MIPLKPEKNKIMGRPQTLLPVGWSVLVEPDRASPKTNLGLYLAEMSQLPACTGRLIAISAKAAETHPELRLGQRLHFKPFGGLDFRWYGRKLKLLREEDTLAILTQVVEVPNPTT